MDAQQLIAALNANADDERDLFNKYKLALATAETQKQVLVGANVQAMQDLNQAVQDKLSTQKDKDAIQALYDTAVSDLAKLVDTTDSIENDAREGLPGVPPIDTGAVPGDTTPVDPDPTTPTDPAVVGMLVSEYPDVAAFNAAAAAYTGAESVNLDGNNVKSGDAGLAPANYYTHDAGVINTTPTV